MTSNHLPRKETFFQNYVDQNINRATIGDESCVICHDMLRLASEDGPDRVVRLPCEHVLHLNCLYDMTKGYARNRNKCPLCRETLFEKNLLSPQNEALRRHEETIYYNPTAKFETETFTLLVANTDVQFVDQVRRFVPFGTEDYEQMVKSVRTLWMSSSYKHVSICQEHDNFGVEWLDVIIAQRVREQLRVARLNTSRAGQAFLHALDIMEDKLEELWNIVQNRTSFPGLNVETAEVPVNARMIEGLPPDAQEVHVGTDGRIYYYLFDQDLEERGMAGPPGARDLLSITLPLMQHPWDPLLDDDNPKGADSVDSSTSSRSVQPSRISPPRGAADVFEAYDQSARSIRPSHSENENRIQLRLLREYIQRDRIIVTEMRNVASVDVYGERTRCVKNLDGNVVGLIKDVDGYSTIGDFAIFWRFR